MSNMSDDHSKILARFSDDLAKEFKGSVEDFRLKAQETLEIVHEGFNKALDEELNAFSSRLGGLANRLAEDYGPLTDNFHKLIEVLGEWEKKRK